MLRIRDIYPGSDFFPSRIPDPNCLHPGSRIRIKEFKYFKQKKLFLSSRKYDPGCSSRIPDPDADIIPSPDPGSSGQKGTGSRIRIRNTVYYRKWREKGTCDILLSCLRPPEAWSPTKVRVRSSLVYTRSRSSFSVNRSMSRRCWLTALTSGSIQ